MYYGARYYDPELSRFITADTVYDRGTQGLNRYSYALNNPIRYHDPSGHESYDPDEHVERTNELLDLQVHLEGTDGIPLGELADGDPSAYDAVQGALGVGGDLQPATVDTLEAMRTELGLLSPERADVLTAEDVDGIMSRKAERQAAHPVLDKWAEIGTASGEGEKFFAISAFGSLAKQKQAPPKAVKTSVKEPSNSQDASSKAFGSNPFKGKTPQEIDKLLTTRGFKKVGPDPLSGRGSYFHPKTGRKYYIDPGSSGYKGGARELPHVDVHKMAAGKNLENMKRKYPLGDKLYDK